MKSRGWAGLLASALILSPVLVLLVNLFSLSHSELSEFSFSQSADIFLFSIEQAALSAFVATVAGVLAALGFLRAAQKLSPASSMALELASLLPNAAPVLIFLLAVMKFAPSMRGLYGIVVVHALLNIGLVGVMLASVARDKLSVFADLAWIEGASPWRFMRQVAWPLMRSELAKVFLFVFVICFTSISVPLMLGGSRATTVEVAIWQKIRIDSDWAGAIQLSLLQMMTIFALTLGLARRSPVSPRLTALRSPMIGAWIGLPIALLPTMILIAGLFSDLPSGMRELADLPALREELPVLFVGSMAIALGVGAMVAILLLLLTYADIRGWGRRLLLGYTAPSTVLTAFAVLLVWREMGAATYLKIIFALSIVSLPAFYRLRWDAVLQDLSLQRSIARTLGANELLIFRSVLLPQLLRPLAWISGLATVWAWGDFALSGVIAERNLTIAMELKALLESYRFAAATVLVWIVIFGSILTFILFNGAARVFSAKLKT